MKHALNLRLPVAVLAAAVLAACAGPALNPNLESARSAYNTAASDPEVVRVAPRELALAQDELQRGDAAFKEGKKPDVIDHYAYLAQQRAQVAVESARAARADQTSAEAQTQRDRIVLASRTREAEQARQSADRARLDAEAAKQQALASQQQALASQQQAAAAQQQAAALADQLAALQARQTERGMVLTIGDVLFDTGKATLKPGAMKTIDDLSAFLQQHPERKVLIEGYTDSTGSTDTNLDLSQRRANAVRDELTRRNVSFDRVQVHGLGERYPVAGNESGAGRQLNRRVEVVFSNPSGTFDSPRS